MDREALLERARGRGVNPILYWLVRAILQPFFHVYFRLTRIGREHIPAHGPVILAANHRSFLDPFVIAVMARRPIYFLAKKELFINRPVAWLLASLGAFPIDRHGGDQGAMVTAQAILERGDGVLIFPEGTRIRPGALGTPRRGVGRLALETGAPVVPVAVVGTDVVAPPGKTFGRFTRPIVRFGPALDFSRYEGLENDRYILRSITDEIMYEIMRLSGQEYVDMYAARAKEESKKAPAEAPAEQQKAS
jgi:1-acyl-sn-glycerol-3-phosphate acyltransferase